MWLQRHLNSTVLQHLCSHSSRSPNALRTHLNSLWTRQQCSGEPDTVIRKFHDTTPLRQDLNEPNEPSREEMRGKYSKKIIGYGLSASEFVRK